MTLQRSDVICFSSVATFASMSIVRECGVCAAFDDVTIDWIGSDELKWTSITSSNNKINE